LAISSAGYLSFQSSKIISEVLANELTVRKARRYGDAWLNTLQHFGAPGLSNLRYMVLLGDPSMSIDKPRYPTIIKLH
jgi:hypothetical protein